MANGVASLTDQLQERVFDKYGIPRWVWEPIMLLESGGNPRAHNTRGEDSRGLFQINIKANPQYAKEDLFDPFVNAEIAARDFIAPVWQRVSDVADPGRQAQEVWRRGIRPYWTQEKAERIYDLAWSVYRDTTAVTSPTTGVHIPNFSIYEDILLGQTTQSYQSPYTIGPAPERGTLSRFWDSLKSAFGGRSQFPTPQEELEARRWLEEQIRQRGGEPSQEFQEGTRALESLVEYGEQMGPRWPFGDGGLSWQVQGVRIGIMLLLAIVVVVLVVRMFPNAVPTPLGVVKQGMGED